MLNCSWDSSRWMYRLLSSRPGIGGAGAGAGSGSGAGATSATTSTGAWGSTSSWASAIWVLLSPSVFMPCFPGAASAPLVQEFCRTYGEIGEDAIGTRAFEGGQRFEDHRFGQPAVLDRGHVHGVLAAD